MHSYDPRVDVVFKKIFGTEENKDLLISLVNAVLSEEDQVEEITLLNPYTTIEELHDKISILDIRAQAKKGHLINVEIQIRDERSYDKRALYYWAKMYTEQLKEGEDYTQLNKAIGIHIFNFTPIKDAKDYHNVFHVLSKDNMDVEYFKDLELHTIELPKFIDDLPSDKGELTKKLQKSLDIWAAFLAKHHILEGLDLDGKVPVQKAIKVIDTLAMDNREREIYEGRQKFLRAAATEAAVHRAEGRIEGRIEGRVEGRVEGEKAKAIEVARGMLKDGLPVETIAKYSGLSVEEIESL